MDELGEKYNTLVRILKRLSPMLALIASMCIESAFGADLDGKAKLGSLRSTSYVVTGEVDSVFSQWKGSEYDIWKSSMEDSIVNFASELSMVNDWMYGVDHWRTNKTFVLEDKTMVEIGLDEPKSNFVFKSSNGEYTSLGDIIGGCITSETDPIFTSFQDRTKNIVIGHHAQSAADFYSSGIAIGAAITSSAEYRPNEPNYAFNNGGYSYDFIGPTVAGNNATAYGDGA